MIEWLPEEAPPAFPDTSKALKDPDGLLAAGGCLKPDWLISAYSQGIFPWYDRTSPILWWSPAPRTVVTPENFRIGRTLRKQLRRNSGQNSRTVTCNMAFSSVISACSEPREDQGDTWITDEMKAAYIRLHQSGYAHSAELWDDEGKLAGGLYGVMLGKVFFGESMFSRSSGASKEVFAKFADMLFRKGVMLIDCQMHTEHLARFGAVEMARTEFERYLSEYTQHTDAIRLGGRLS